MARSNVLLILAPCSILLSVAFIAVHFDLLSLSQSVRLQHYNHAPFATKPTSLIDLLRTQSSAVTSQDHVDLKADHEGYLFHHGRKSIISPNGKYELRWSPVAHLELSRLGVDGARTLICWTGGGRAGAADRNVSSMLHIDPNGRLSIRRKEAGMYEFEYWHSRLLAQCNADEYEDIDDLTHFSVKTKRQTLRLHNTGSLEIAGRCLLHEAKSTNNRGRLALIVSGLLRNLNKTCHAHVEKIAQHPQFESVDVFVYALYEHRDPVVNATAIEADARTCYGPYLKNITILPLEEVEEAFPGEIVPSCGDKLHRLYSQLKTLYQSGQLWQDWSIRMGKIHDTVLRIRTDHEVLGRGTPWFELPPHIGHDTLILPNTREDHIDQWYCPRPDGSWQAGEFFSHSHIGSLAWSLRLTCTIYRNNRSGRLWLTDSHATLPQSLPRIPHIVQQAAKGEGAYRDFFGCGSLPSGLEEEDCRGSDCSIECIVAWHLTLWGVKTRPQWSWNMEILRG